MRITLLTVTLLFTLTVPGQSVNKIHYKAVLVDGHNDVLSSQVLDGIDISHRVKEGHSDLVRWKEGGLDVQFFSVWTGQRARNKEGFFKDATQEIDSLHALVLRNPERMKLAMNYRDVKKGIRRKQLVSLIGVEGGHMIEDDIRKLEELHKMGMRYLTLTWNNSTPWASSAMDETERPDSLQQKGLTDFGRQVVKRMNELGIIVDLSHTGEQTFYDAISVTTKPVMLSHSSVWAICPVFRNVKDDQIKAVAKNGGVICINFYSGFISKAYDEKQTFLADKVRDTLQQRLLAENNNDSSIMRSKWREYYRSAMVEVKPTIGQLVDHIDHIVKLVGDDYVGIGSDYDGVSALPVGLEDVTTYPRITQELLSRGYSKRSIKKILGGNVLRVMKANFN
jgi:membrane dipeptidase